MVYSDQLKRRNPENWQVQDMHKNDLFKIIKPKINKFSGTEQYIMHHRGRINALTDGTPSLEGRKAVPICTTRIHHMVCQDERGYQTYFFVGDYSEDLLRDAIFSTGFMGVQTSREAFGISLTIRQTLWTFVKGPYQTAPPWQPSATTT